MKISTLNPEDENFEDNLGYKLWSTGSESSDASNSRDRPYDGQPHTMYGKRGKTEIEGLTIRDIEDCFIMALLESSPEDEYLEPEEFSKCWDFSGCKNDGDKPKPTIYLLEMQKKGKYISTKVDCGNWIPQDIYKIDLSKVDMGAVSSNLACRIEKMMGIFPNIDPDDNIEFVEDKGII